MDDKEFEFKDENEFEDEDESPESQAFTEQFNALVDQELNREKTLMVNPIVMQKVYSAMNLIRKIKWEEPLKMRFDKGCVGITRSITIQILCSGNTFVKKSKDVLINLIQMSDEFDISKGFNPEDVSIGFTFENYLIEVDPN